MGDYRINLAFEDDRLERNRGNWAARTAYSVGDKVTNAGVDYICISGYHISSPAFATDQARHWVARSQIVPTTTSTPAPQLGAVGDVPTPTPANDQQGIIWNQATNAWIFVPLQGKFRGDWAATTAYALGDMINNAGTLYRVTVAHTSPATFNTTNLAAIGVGKYKGDWATTTAYTVGDVVWDGNAIYRCTVAHTSGATLAANAANWALIGASRYRGDWTTGTAYQATDVVWDAGTLYRCTTAHTAGATRAAHAANWAAIGASKYRGDFANATAYAVGDVVWDNNLVYRCITAYTSGATLAANAANWALIGANRYRGDWVTATAYTAGDVVWDGGTLYRCTVAHTAGATRAADAANWASIGASAFKGDWSATTLYAVGNVVHQSGTLYRCVTAHTSAAAFNTHLANWAPVGGRFRGDFVTGTWYQVGDIAQEGDNLYQKITSAMQGGANLAGDAHLWMRLTNRGPLPWAATTRVELNEMRVQNNLLYRSNAKRLTTGTWNAAEQANWTAIGASSYKGDWASGTAYAVADVVYQDFEFYRCVTAHTAGATFAGDIANWFQVTSNYEGDWQTGRAYAVGDIVYQNNSLYRCNTAHTAPATFVQAPNWTSVSGMSLYKGEWASGAIYAQNDVVHNNGTLYRCITNHTAGATIAADIANWNVVSGRLRIWLTAQPYTVGDVVWDSGALYRCSTAHTAGATFAGDAANWAVIGASKYRGDFTASTAYTVGDVVNDAGILYRCITAYTSGATRGANAANWQIVSYPAALNFLGGSVYRIREMMFHAGRLWSRNSGGTAGATFDAAEAANWTPTSQYPDLNWTTGRYYVVGDVVEDSNSLSICITAHLAGATFAGDAANWNAIGSSKYRGDWAATTAYAVADVVFEGGNLYRCVTAHTSGATRAANAANWANIGVGAFVGDWATGTAYTVGQVVVNNDQVYRCITAHTAGASLEADLANWRRHGGSFRGDWVTGRRYIASNVVYDITTATLYRTLTTHTAGASVTADIANWTPIAQSRYRGDWAATTAYAVADVVWDANVLYRCVTAHTSGATRAANAANWAAVGASKYRGDYANGTVYAIGDVVWDGGRLYRCVTAYTGAATRAANAANWNPVPLALPVSVTNAVAATDAHHGREVLLRGGAAAYSADLNTLADGFRCRITNEHTAAHNVTVTNVNAIVYRGSPPITLTSPIVIPAGASQEWVMSVNGPNRTLTVSGARDLSPIEVTAATAIIPAHHNRHFVVNGGSFTFDQNTLPLGFHCTFFNVTAGPITITTSNTANVQGVGERRTNYATGPIVINPQGALELTIVNWGGGANDLVVRHDRSSPLMLTPVGTTIPVDGQNASNIVATVSALTGNATVAAPTNVPDYGVITYSITASGADRLVTFPNATFKGPHGPSTTIAPFTIPNGVTKVVRFVNLSNTYYLISDTPTGAAGVGYRGDYAPGQAYAVGDVVYDAASAKMWRCVTAYTAGAALLANQGNWRRVSNQYRGDWVTGTVYEVGDLIYSDLELYRANVTHTSAATFAADNTRWDQVTSNYQGDWVQSRNYSVGDVAVNANRIYRCVTAHSSSASFASDAANWSELGANSAPAWAASSAYAARAMVEQHGRLWFRTAAGTSGAAWDATESALWTPVGKYADGNWAASRRFTVGDTVAESDDWYRCITAHFSSAAFTTDAANWTKLSIVAANAWTANRVLKQREVVEQHGRLWSRDAAGTAGATWDNTEAANYTPAAPYSNQNWVTARRYEVGDTVVQGGQQYICTTAHFSSAAFATDSANWSGVGGGAPVAVTANISGQSVTFDAANNDNWYSSFQPPGAANSTVNIAYPTNVKAFSRFRLDILPPSVAFGQGDRWNLSFDVNKFRNVSGEQLLGMAYTPTLSGSALSIDFVVGSNTERANIVSGQNASWYRRLGVSQLSEWYANSPVYRWAFNGTLSTSSPANNEVFNNSYPHNVPSGWLNTFWTLVNCGGCVRVGSTSNFPIGAGPTTVANNWRGSCFITEINQNNVVMSHGNVLSGQNFYIWFDWSYHNG